MYSRRGLLISCYIFLGFCNNFQNTIVRVLAIALWIIIPMILLIKSKSLKIANKEYRMFLTYSVSIVLLFLSIIVNIESFKFELNGPTVEKLTPFLGFFTLPFFFLVSSLKGENIQNHIKKAIILTLGFFLFEMFYRLFIAPNLFLNYFNRQAAKTIGLMTTTNVNGQALAMLFSALLFIKFPRKKTILFIISIILISTMARSAVVAIIISLFIYSFIKLKNSSKYIILSAIVILVISDPLNFVNDGSFLSKIEFIRSTILIVKNSDLSQILFGYGMNYEKVVSTLGVQNWSPHIPFLKAYFYFGILGLMNYMVSLLLLIYFDRQFLFPMITYFVFSLAGAPIFWPGLFSTFLILLFDEKYYSNRKEFKTLSKHKTRNL